MQTLRRSVAVLTFPAVAWLGAACERTDTPTAAWPMALVTDPAPQCFTVDGVIGPEWTGVTPTFVPYSGFTGDSRDGQLVGFNVYARADADCFYMGFQAVPMPGDQWDDAFILSLGSSANVYLDTDVNGTSDLIIEALAGDYCNASGSPCAVIGDPALGPNVWSVGNMGAPGPMPVGGVREVALPWVTLQTDPDNLGFPLSKCSVNLRTVQAFGYNFSGSQFPNRFGTYSQPGCVSPPPPSLVVTGGGQIDVNMTGVRGSFGFNAKGSGSAASGHLNYMNHFTGARVDCSVNAVMQLTATKVRLSGTTCSPRSTSASFTADVEDKANPGKGADTFRITYNNNMMITTTDEGTLTSGEIKIHK